MGEKELDRRDLNIALMLCLVVVIFFIIFVKPSEFTIRGDAEFHFQKTIGNTEYRPVEQGVYASLFHILARPLVYNYDSFKFVMLILLAILTPMALFFISKKWQTVLVYFAGSHYFWYMWKSPSQATALLLFLGLFLTKNIYLRILIVVLSIGAHSHGFILTSITLLVLLFFEHKEKFHYFWPACSTIFGKNRPDEFLDIYIAGSVEFGLKVGVIGNLFGKLLPLPIMWLGLKQVWIEKRWDVLFLTLLGFFAVVIKSERTIYIIPLLLIPYVGIYISLATKKFRYLFYFCSIFFLLFNILTWINEKVGC